MTRAAIYTRVSSTSQEQDGTSLGSQLATCRDYAAEHGYTIIGEYSDTWTGSQYRERPGLSEIRKRVRAGEVDVVLCYALDRFSRDQTHTAVLIDELEHRGARLELVTEQFDDTSTGRLIRSVQSFVGEMEREKIAERTTRGKKARLQSGKLLPNGKPLYGYRWRDDDRGRLQIYDPEARIVRRIYREYAGGASFRAIAGQLTEEGVPTPTGRNHRWSASTVRRILLNPAYHGEPRGWANHRGVDPDFLSGIKLPAGVVPPIVTRQAWDTAQEHIATNKQRAVRNAREPEKALLRGGFAACGYCNSPMHPRPRHQHDWYEYVCGANTHMTRTCRQHAISANILDQAMWVAVHQIMNDDDLLEREIERRRSYDPTRGRAEVIASELAEIDRQEARLTTAISQTTNDTTIATLVRQLDRIAERRTTLDDELATIEAERAAWDAWEADARDLIDVRRDMAANLDELVWKERRIILHRFGMKARIWATDHDPRFEIFSTLTGQTVISTSSGENHSLELTLHWTDRDLLPYIRVWAQNYDCCIDCGDTARPHKGHGLCNRCYRRARRRQGRR